jgi:hypothetical protein
MKKLENFELEGISGGDFWDGVCTGLAAGGLVVGIIATVPGLNVAGGIVTGACVAYWFLK